jgi:hypothetical protein
MYAYLFSFMYVTCPTNVIILDLTTWIDSGAGINHRAPPYADFSSPLLLSSYCIASNHISCSQRQQQNDICLYVDVVWNLLYP